MILTATDQYKRIINLNEAEQKASNYHKKLRIRDYKPGQVIYHLGDYPHPFKIEPTEYDEKLIKQYHDRGYELIQLHTDWADSHRLYGGTKYTSHDPKGLQKFVDLCHEHDIKILPYLSSTFIGAEDPDFKEEFTRMVTYLRGGQMNYRVCWSGSPSWREFIWKKSMEVLDEYGFDGIYNDMGHDLFLKKYIDDVEGVPGGETLTELPYEAEVEDLLALFYEEMKQRGLIYKLHIGNLMPPNTKEKVYDYLYVGEGTRNVKDIIEGCKDIAPYLVPAFDRRVAKISDPDMVYAYTIPFVQFPLLYHGRPITQYGNIEGLKVFESKEFDGKIMTHEEEAVKHLIAHPDEPTYSEWSSVPDDIHEFDRSSRYLALYKPMVAEGSVVRVNVRNCGFIKSDVPQEVYTSLFTNEEQYMVVSNLGTASYELVLNDAWQNRETGVCGRQFTIHPDKIIFLKKA